MPDAAAVPPPQGGEHDTVKFGSLTERYSGVGMLGTEPDPLRAAQVDLLDKANRLVEMLDDAERNHGALIGTRTLRAANELRLAIDLVRKLSVLEASV